MEGADLRLANLESATLTNANLRATNLKVANLADAIDLSSANFSDETVYDQWTVFPPGFDAAAAGLTFINTDAGDLDSDGQASVMDIDLLHARILADASWPSWLPDAAFDLNGDQQVTSADYQLWVEQIAGTWTGDANLDGQFNSSDLVLVFAAGEFENTRPGATWTQGDWNADDVFDSRDLVAAFQAGGYEAGPRTGIQLVPEPTPGLFVWIVGLPD